MGKNVRNPSLRQVSSCIQALGQKRGLGFREILDSDQLSRVISKHIGDYRERVFSPHITLLAFLSQIFSSDRSCREAVAQVNADRISAGLLPASSDTGAYCKARERIPEGMVHDLVLETGKEMEGIVPGEWLWKERHVKIVDGSTAVTADTPENAEEFGRGANQRGKQVGFPLVRLVAVFSLATGCVMDIACSPFRGKGTGELSLFRKVLSCVESGDVVIGDAQYVSYLLISHFITQGVDCVFFENIARKNCSKVVEKLGKNDEILMLEKSDRPKWMDKETFDKVPKTLKIRRTIVTIDRPGFRSRKLTLLSTILDSKYASPNDLGELYRQRWHAEINLNSLKTVLHMEFLSSKTPQMVRKEIFGTALGYNLIRRLIGQAAYTYGILPKQISFKGAIQTLNKYRLIWQYSSTIDHTTVLEFLLQAVARHRIGNRPNRIEPRAIKRPRRKGYPFLKSRAQARRKLLKSACA